VSFVGGSRKSLRAGAGHASILLSGGHASLDVPNLEEIVQAFAQVVIHGRKRQNHPDSPGAVGQRDQTAWN
jgi:hypothetical protein